MSRVGKQPVPVPDKTKVDIKDNVVTITGPRGTLCRAIHPDIMAELKENKILVTRSTELKKHRALHGLTRSLINNMIIGVTDGFKRELKIIGVGYRAEMKNPQTLVMHLGYSHPIIFGIPEGITVSVIHKENLVTVEGTDKEVVGAVAAKIRSFRKPDPYKGKGVRYVGEYGRSKTGKAAASSGA